MNIKPLLVRLQNTIGRDDLIEQIVLLSTPKISVSKEAQSAKSINLIVGYNSSPNSHTALDIALLIAHQTRLATKAHVTVQVVYIIEDHRNCHGVDDVPREETPASSVGEHIPLHFLTKSSSEELNTGIITQTKLQDNTTYSRDRLVDRFAQAERILREASCLAAEWKTSFKAHLRFGCITSQFRQVVESEQADILFLGCHSRKHPIVRKLGSQFPCSILGVPTSLSNKHT
ncbi:MAG: universal stress protein [Scytonema sp. PMC 1069.18]|nr:universal stress protein [Scytonema sp. PMC 1069.18]MEC4880123.1 universal stress protein [Scytonema sp. PMC 1070.18]